MDPTLSYLVAFLLGEKNETLTSLVSYGDDGAAPLVIEPSGFFSEGVYLTEKSLPILPLPELDGVPVLFGEPIVREQGGRLFLGADLIASAFFLLSRYEECVRRKIRDRHGRFPGRESLPYRAGFLLRPVVEEYGALLRRLLRRVGKNAVEPAPGLRHVWLTHDVDALLEWDGFYHALRSAGHRFRTGKPGKLQPLLSFCNYRKYDPAYTTFPYLMEQDEAARAALGTERCTPVYFLQACEQPNRGHERRSYIFRHPRQTADLLKLLSGGGREIGYHVSYAAALDKSLVGTEAEQIRALTGRPVTLSRNHYLASLEPEDYYSLLDAGLTDDFTMGYADEAGFRLGTCRPVRWMDPVKRALTPLTLHHLTVMDCTLDSLAYMNIQNEDAALSVIKELLDVIHAHGGEAALLWHSPSVDPHSGTYQRSLYRRAMELLCRRYSGGTENANA